MYSGNIRVSNSETIFLVIVFTIVYFTSGSKALTSDGFLQVALHDRCNDDDPACDLPLECCCKPTHNYGFRRSLENMSSTESTMVPVHVLCVNATMIPPNLPKQIESFKLLSTEMTELTNGSFNSSSSKNLTNIYIWKNFHLTTIRDYAFDDLESLRTIILEDVPSLSVIEQHAFSNLPSLRELRLKRTGLLSVPLFTGLSSSSYIPVKIVLEDSKITQVQTGAFSTLPSRIKMVQFSWNMQLTVINDYAFSGSSIAQLILNNNKQLTTLQPRAFHGLDKMIKLNLAGTSISTLPTLDLGNLTEIDVRHTPNLHRFPAAVELPSLRVAFLTYTYHCCSLNAYGFGRTYEETANYKHRNSTPCDDDAAMQLLPRPNNPHGDYEKDDTNESDYDKYEDSYEDISGFFDLDWGNYTVPTNVHMDSNAGERIFIYHEREDNDAYDGHASFFQRIYQQNFAEGSWEHDYEESTAAMELEGIGGWRPDRIMVPTDATQTVKTTELCYYDSNGNKVRDVYKTPVKCTPKPDAFNPCENVLGNPVLPAISWIVSALAIIGNLLVILVLSVVTCDRACARQHNLSVQKFLVLNLAVADMCMGLYLLMISAMDARSAGEYYKYGVEWQTGIGCKIAGFLSIFSSQLSVYTLSVISMERWYAIHYAIHLDKRMTMRCARICILFGWMVSFLLAVLPLVGVNNYEKTSICLPFDVSQTSGMAYVAVLICIAITAFVVDVICYLWMYTTVRTVSYTDGSRDSVFRRKRRSSLSSTKSGGYHGVNATTDATVAKRMAVLVFTNFACFFPISFFALTAAAGSPLISISQSKILLVVFYPLNSCCNPFLYAILTKSFRRDLLAWFTSRGYCIPLASKLHVAQWRRNSADPGSAERRDTCVRKRLQQCVKYVSKRKAVHIGVAAGENGSLNAQMNDRTGKIVKNGSVTSPTRLDRAAKNRGKSMFPKHELDNNSNSFSSYHSINNNQPTYMGMSRIFKLALMTKKSDKTSPRSSTYTRGNKEGNVSHSFFPKINWFSSNRKNTGSCHPLAGAETSIPRAGRGDSSPLVEISDSRNEFSLNMHDLKNPPYAYERRASKSRHSTTTIETRLTVGGNMRGSMDHEAVLQDVGVSTP